MSFLRKLFLHHVRIFLPASLEIRDLYLRFLLIAYFAIYLASTPELTNLWVEQSSRSFRGI